MQYEKFPSMAESASDHQLEVNPTKHHTRRGRTKRFVSFCKRSTHAFAFQPSVIWYYSQWLAYNPRLSFNDLIKKKRIMTASVSTTCGNKVRALPGSPVLPVAKDNHFTKMKTWSHQRPQKNRKVTSLDRAWSHRALVLVPR